MPPASMKRFRLLDFARIDGEVQCPGHIFTRADGDAVPERVSAQTPEPMGAGDGFEPKQLKRGPLFIEIGDGPREPAVPLMTGMTCGVERVQPVR
jgi:hypothetical protein